MLPSPGDERLPGNRAAAYSEPSVDDVGELELEKLFAVRRMEGDRGTARRTAGSDEVSASRIVGSREAAAWSC
jgi:hypothetical protein